MMLLTRNDNPLSSLPFFLLVVLSVLYLLLYCNPLLLIPQATEDDRYIFMSSMLGLLSEYGISPRVTNALAISNSVKVFTL